MSDTIQTETITYIEEGPSFIVSEELDDSTKKEIMRMKKEERMERYINYQGELDIELFNNLRDENLATYKLNTKNTDTIWDIEALNKVTLNEDVDKDKMIEFLMPNRDITYERAEYLLSSDPNHLIATMTILSNNYQMNIYDIDKNLSVEEDGYSSYANFLFTRQEEVIFLTGRTLLTVYKNIFESRRKEDEEKSKEEIYIGKLINEIDGVICRYNKGLVRTVASPYRYQAEDDDLMGSGFEGIIKEVLPKFDIDTGNKFSTFATWWIRNQTGREANSNTTIYIPDHMVLAVTQVLSKKNELEKLTGEIIPIDDAIALCRKEQKYFPKKDEDIKMAINAQKEVFSLDEPIRSKIIDEGDNNDRYATIPDPSESVEDTVERELEKEKLYKLLELVNLTFKERIVLEFTYGIRPNTDNPKKEVYTVREIANKLGVNDSEIRRIKDKAMEKLRRSAGTARKRAPYRRRRKE